jgi:hypothetical protein
MPRLAPNQIDLCVPPRQVAAISDEGSLKTYDDRHDDPPGQACRRDAAVDIAAGHPEGYVSFQTGALDWPLLDPLAIRC